MGNGNGNGGMHRQVDWMVPADGSILRYMNAAVDQTGQPAIQTPKSISLNTGYSNRHVATRCRILAERGLLERIDDNAEYRITETGSGLLSGGVNPEELNEESDTGDT